MCSQAHNYLHFWLYGLYVIYSKVHNYIKVYIKVQANEKVQKFRTSQHTCIHTYTRLTALCLGLPGWASTRKVKPIWILLKQEAVSGSCISWVVCKSAPRSRQIISAPLVAAVCLSYSALYICLQLSIYLQFRLLYCATALCWLRLTTSNKRTYNMMNHMPAPHHLVFFRPDALPAEQPTASKHWTSQLWSKR